MKRTMKMGGIALALTSGIVHSPHAATWPGSPVATPKPVHRSHDDSFYGASTGQADLGKASIVDTAVRAG